MLYGISKSSIISIVYALSLTVFLVWPSTSNSQDQNDIENEWWYGAAGTEDLAPPARAANQTVFDRWEQRIRGDRSETDPDHLPSQPGQNANRLSAGHAPSSPTKQTQFLEFLKKTDQSTPYATDPVGKTVEAGKAPVHNKIIKPASKWLTGGSPEPPRPAPSFPQENTININKTSPSDMTFYQRNAPRVRKYIGDPKLHDGGMEVLSTLQTIQHLIDCKNKGSDVRECAKTYILNKAAARAMFEVLQLTGMVTHGVVLSLAYADYVAIKNIMKAYEVTAAMWDDYEQARKQQAANDSADVSNWDGRLDKLEDMVTLF